METCTLQPCSLNTYLRTDCKRSASLERTTMTARTYRVEDVESLLRAVIYREILLDGLVNDLLPGLASFADGLHLQLHLRTISMKRRSRAGMGTTYLFAQEGLRQARFEAHVLVAFD